MVKSQFFFSKISCDISFRTLLKSGCCVRTKWKRQTTAPMRAEQLRNHSCEEKDCPGARRLHQNPGPLTSSSVPTSQDVVTSFCRHCDVMQALTAGGGSAVDQATSHHDAPGNERPTSASSSSFTGQILSRLYLGALPLPFSNYCRL